jgi:hypothetical protein
MRKRAKKHFMIEAKKIALPLRFISLRSENDGNFSLLFRFISSRSENYGSFSLLFSFGFASFHFVSLQISMFRIDAKQAKKHFFSHRIAKKFSSV